MTFYGANPDTDDDNDARETILNTLLFGGAAFGSMHLMENCQQSVHYGTKPGHFETSKIHFPTSEGVSEVSERVNE